MKNKNTYFAVVFLLLSFGCKKDFLDRQPLNELTADSFFQTEQDAALAVNGIYSILREWDCISFPYLGTTDIISDDADKGSTPTDAIYMQEFDDFTFNATNVGVAGVWRGYFKVIASANLVLENLPSVDMPEATRNRYIGEAKFLRAYSYFLLVQWFGDLPLITKPLGASAYYAQVRQPKSAIFAQIEADLNDAISFLPEKSKFAGKDLGRATKGAARGILAKTYMVQHDFAKAESICLDIINSGEYELLPKYSDNFLRVGENGKESVFEIQAVALEPENGITSPGATPYNMVQGVRGIPNLGWGFNRPSDNLVQAYEPGDPRREATIIYVGEVLPDGSAIVQDNPETVGERYNQKAWVPGHPGLQDNGPGNVRILRYADVLLLAAEALNENGKSAEALIYLNKVRQRAKGTSTFILPDVTITDQTQLREKIYKERRAELAMEQHRWFDLMRWGRAEQVISALGKSFVAGKHELLPVPQAEIDLSGLEQNLGW